MWPQLGSFLFVTVIKSSRSVCTMIALEPNKGLDLVMN